MSRAGLAGALRVHWPEYLMEAALLGIFMVSACTFATLLGHPVLPLREAIPSPLARRALMGLAMGGTLIALVLSPWGKQSGAHLNPATTLTFLRLGKVDPRDALFYALFQCAGGIAGVLLMALVLGKTLAEPPVNYAATVPGPQGAGAAFLAEMLMSFALMTVVLLVSNSKRLARFTGLFAGALVAAHITFLDPLSGMSMNPARTLGSAVPAWLFTGLWIYFTAPPLGMLLAAQLHLRLRGLNSVACAKLHHQNPKRCIFCEHRKAREKSAP